MVALKLLGIENKFYIFQFSIIKSIHHFWVINLRELNEIPIEILGQTRAVGTGFPRVWYVLYSVTTIIYQEWMAVM